MSMLFQQDLGMDLENEIGNRCGMPLGRHITAVPSPVHKSGTSFIKQNRGFSKP